MILTTMVISFLSLKRIMVRLRRGITVTLKAHRQVPKNGVLKSIVHVIKHANFEFYWVHPDGVI